MANILSFFKQLRSLMRDMGAAESNVDRFCNRLKKRGQSWVPVGAASMVQAVIKYWPGNLGRYAEHVSKMRDVLNPEKIQEKITDASKDIAGKALRIKEDTILIKGSGTTRSKWKKEEYLESNRILLFERPSTLFN